MPHWRSSYSRRLRTPIDSVLNVYDSKGGNISSNDDGAGSDSTAKFNVPEDGDYFVRIKAAEQLRFEQAEDQDDFQRREYFSRI